MKPLLGAAVLAFGAVALTACGSDDNSGLPGAVRFSPKDIRCASGGGTLLSSGSSAQANAMEVWVNSYQANCDGSRVTYKATGSGAGVQEFLQGTTAFAGTDAPLTDAETAASRSVCADGGRAVHLPMLAGPIAVGYNLPGVDGLVLDAPTLARIFDSAVDRWDDPAIARLNPDADLPDLPITPFHRSDGSGTTANFTAYLAAAAPDAWPHEPDKTWRGRGGQSADGSSGLIGQVQQNEGAIAYVELSHAHRNGVATARLDTGAGRPVAPRVETASRAVDRARVTGEDGDLVLTLDHTARSPGVYPIVLITYEIVCDRGNRPSTLPLTRAFLGYTASDQGQRDLAGIDYAPLPDRLAEQVRERVAGLS
ncbi:phosphate ABC transporter substrate-binding protein PstS [Streptomyces sp. RFCAC02]|uniref:phosphate ABC transporter substrate-binding protein PstS n=1 Tax=Streptomyces sp. RFCAC02 TaxID=2499143 RepID=UPI001F0E5BB9|nr:phosphate ABC transporter substrate-binding protein PstS [Streptomyces sp. RFCAC02]